MTSQRDMVRASLMAPITRETHSDVYSKRLARAGRVGVVNAATVSRSIQDLGVLLAAAEGSEARSWLVLRLRNRLDVLEALDVRGGQLSPVSVDEAQALARDSAWTLDADRPEGMS